MGMRTLYGVTAAAVLLLALLLASGVEAHRSLQGGRPDDTPGRRFNFKPDGGARALLDKLEPAKLQRILANSKSPQLDQLITKLDEDDDFVSSGRAADCAGRPPPQHGSRAGGSHVHAHACTRSSTLIAVTAACHARRASTWTRKP